MQDIIVKKLKKKITNYKFHSVSVYYIKRIFWWICFVSFLHCYALSRRVRQEGMGERERGGHAAKDHGQDSNPGRCA